MLWPSVGQIVHYKLSEADCREIDARSPQRRESGSPGGSTDGVDERNSVHPGQVYAAMVVAALETDGPTANLMVQLDGYGQYWATSRNQGDEPGQYSWPKFAV